MGPLVSVVMPSFNQQAFIGIALDSVLAQDYARVELIVADGGSTDGTVDVLRERARSDPRLRWFSEPDSGPAEALNKGFAQVRGTVIGWLNSDDQYEAGAIGRAVNAFAAHPHWIMVYGHGRHIDAEGRFISTYATSPPSVPLERFADHCLICQPTALFRRTMYLLLGALDQNLKAAFDYEYWLRAFHAFPGRIGFIDAVQASSRLHDGCITRTMRRSVAVEAMEVVARHFGAAPSHWLTTYAEELLARPAQERPADGLRAHLLATLMDVRAHMQADEYARLQTQIESDPRLKTAQ